MPRSAVMPRKFQASECKGESYETQNQSQGGKALRKPQHHCSLTLLGLMTIPRSEVIPESFNLPNPKENRMNLKTKIKAGKLAGNHNTIVR